jgi:hypothetical protein
VVKFDKRETSGGPTTLTMTAAHTFQELVVWQKAHRFVLEAYAFTANFPKSELYALTAQLRRAAVSIRPTSLKAFVAAETLTKPNS